MSDQNKIEVGDRVTVIFAKDWSVRGEVLYMPQSKGECWIIKETQPNGRQNIHYAQTFHEIMLDGKA